MNEEMLQNINRRLDDALERGRKIVEDEELAEQIDELRIRAEALIRKHPLKSVGAGLLAGYIIGKLFRED